MSELNETELQHIAYMQTLEIQKLQARIAELEAELSKLRIGDAENMKLQDYVPMFIEALKGQLDEDEMRWGDTWKHRSKEGQEIRTKGRFDEYFSAFVNNGIPVPWLKIAGGALICWVREQLASPSSEVKR